VDKIKHQVAVAHRRLVVQQFLAIVAGTLFATLLVAAGGLAVPKLWVLPLEPAVWNWSWVAGGAAAGLLAASIWTWFVRRSAIDAAIEIDRRCQLQERVSSVLSLSPAERNTEIGQALVQDAIRRVERLDLRHPFAVSLPRRLLLPLLPAALIGLLIGLVPNAVPDPQAAAASSRGPQAEQARRSARKLQEQLARAKQQAEQQGLPDADVLFKELRRGLDELLNQPNLDHKQALVRMNDLAKSLQQRRDQMGDVDQLRQRLAGLKDLATGPADKIAAAMKAGDFQQALDELNKLQETLRDGQLTDEEQQQFAQQLEQLQKRLQELADAHDQAKRELEQELQRRQAAGDLAGAGKLQQQLDQLNRLNEPLDALQNMAQQLGQCRQCLQDGDGQAAAAQLDSIAQSLQELQQQSEQLETLEQLLDEVAMAKEAMGCQQCAGQGCEACWGRFGNGPGQGDEPGSGLGQGRGQGERPEAETETASYESRVPGQVQPGEAVRTGSAGGPNQPGQTLQAVKDQLQSSFAQEADPLIDLRLPKKEREHTRDYFRRYRQGD
jgi:hypothetical protein